jgi:phenylalanyl-tRNA synthetase alpha chain
LLFKKLAKTAWLFFIFGGMQEIFDKANQALAEIQAQHPADEAALEQYRIRYLGTKSVLKDLFGEMAKLPNDQKKAYGQLMNTLKAAAEDKYQSVKDHQASTTTTPVDAPDLTAPGYPITLGTRHPISIVRARMIAIFASIGFTIAEGPEIEDDWHNFGALGTPPDHPARDMQDTFYITPDLQTLLRTQTSSVQIRMMQAQRPPLRIIMPGRVYRNETISARAHCTFHQVEGLYINKDVSFADLRQTMYFFAREMFGQDTEIRFRPSFFPFTEPSAEMDISCFICSGSGCAVCKQSGWVEIGGCGMVDPQVMIHCDLDPQQYSGFAFGMGIERITMLKYQINDLRLFFQNDLRFLRQFESA